MKLSYISQESLIQLKLDLVDPLSASGTTCSQNLAALRALVLLQEVVKGQGNGGGQHHVAHGLLEGHVNGVHLKMTG